MKTSNLHWLALAVVLGASLTSLGQIVLLDTAQDFSIAGQGTNGLFYGYYDTTGTTGNFLTNGMYPNALGPFWDGPDQDGATPQFQSDGQHEGASNGVAVASAVRRYVFGSFGEPPYSGPVTLAFQIWKTPFGLVGDGADAFITFNGIEQFHVRVPNGSTQTKPYVSSTMVLNVKPGDALDLGTTDLGATASRTKWASPPR